MRRLKIYLPLLGIVLGYVIPTTYGIIAGIVLSAAFIHYLIDREGLTMRSGRLVYVDMMFKEGTDEAIRIVENPFTTHIVKVLYYAEKGSPTEVATTDEEIEELIKKIHKK